MIVRLIDQFPNHLIVELLDVDMPIVDVTRLKYSVPWHISNDNNDNKRTVAGPIGPKLNADLHEFMNKMLSDHVYPAMGKDPRFLDFLDNIQSGENRFMICKDQAGWFQEVHCDLGRLAVSGVIHITDTDSPTRFYNNQEQELLLYTAPCKARTGAFWLNLKDSWHEVPVGTKERNHMITFVGPKET